MPSTRFNAARLRSRSQAHIASRKPGRKADLEALRDYHKEIIERRDRLQRELTAPNAASRVVAGATTRTASAATALDADGLEALDHLADDGAFGNQFVHSRPTLGAAVRRAYRELRPVDVLQGEESVLRVGTQGWTAPLMEAVIEKSEWASSLDLTTEAVPPLRTVVEQLGKVLAAARKVGETDVKVVSELSQLLEKEGALLAALNEVMTALTPARWAYTSLSADVKLERGKQLEFQDEEKIRTAYRLNTAELNTFALGFFLVCARRVANPLRLLVLDDPLHNMDELTVTTVARGISKILRLWAELDASGSGTASWQVLLLLHGEEDAERFREEVPCALYRLPWLLPSQEDLPDKVYEVPFKPTRLLQEFQKLADFIGASPSS